MDVLCLVGAGFGTWSLRCCILVGITLIVAVFANFILGGELSLADVSDSRSLFSRAVRPGNFATLSDSFRVVLSAVSDFRPDGSFHLCGCALLFRRLAGNRHRAAGSIFVGSAWSVGLRGLQ